MQPVTLIELQYLPPIQYFARLVASQKVIFEQHEHYVKTSYRNRCYICGPNGQQRLSIPLQKGKNEHQTIQSVQIAEDTSWQRVHWQSLETCYRSSPYFEFYEDEFYPFYHEPQQSLWKLNWELTQLLLRLLDVELEYAFTESYEKTPPEGVEDWRSIIHPKPHRSPNPQPFETPKYHQVFEEKTGFIENVSIIDLLFNEGPGAAGYLKTW